MAVVIRLKRMGANKKIFFRIVAADKAKKRDGRFLEELGYYDPRRNPAAVKINKERLGYWLKAGARPSPTVQSLIKKTK